MNFVDSGKQGLLAPPTQLYIISLTSIETAFAQGLTVRQAPGGPDLADYLFGGVRSGFLQASHIESEMLALAQRLATQSQSQRTLFVYRVNASRDFFPLRESVLNHIDEYGVRFHRFEIYRRFLAQLIIFGQIDGPENHYVTTADIASANIIEGAVVTMDNIEFYSNPAGVQREDVPSERALPFLPPAMDSPILGENLRLRQLQGPLGFLIFFCCGVVQNNRGARAAEIDVANTGATQLLLTTII